MSFTSVRRDLWLVVAAKAVSLLGDEVAAVALVLRLQSHGAGAGAVAALLIAALAPLLLLASVVGRLVDRYDSRNLLLTSSLIQAVVCTALAFVSATPAILALVAVLGAGQAVNGATWQALLPTIAGPDELPRAVGMSQAGSTIASIAAPAIGGLLTGWYGPRVPLLVDAATYLAITAAGLLISTRRRAVAPSSTERQRGGLHIVRTHPVLRVLFVLLGLFVLIGSMVNVIEVFLIRQTLHASTVWYGIVGATFGLGLLGGALVGGRLRGDRALVRAFVLSATGLAAGIVATGLAPSVVWVLPAAFATGAFNGVLSVALGSLVMGRARAEERGRVGAVLNGLASGTQLAAYVLGAVLALALTPREIFVLAGGLGGLAPICFGRSLIRSVTPPDRATLTAVGPPEVAQSVA